MESSSPFSRLLVEHRKARGLSRSQLSERSELSYPYISQLETGQRKPSRKAAYALAMALDIDPLELEQSIPSADNLLERQRAEAFTSQRLSSPERSIVSELRAEAPAVLSSTAGAESDREDLLGDMLDLLEEFEPSERVEVLGELQTRAMQRMLDQSRFDNM